MSEISSGYKEVLGISESLAIFIRQMSSFDRRFCELMNAGNDFTIKLEIHGNNGQMIHCRVLTDGFERPRNTRSDAEHRRR